MIDFTNLYNLLEQGYNDKINTFGALCHFYMVTGALEDNEYTRKNNFAGIRDRDGDLKSYNSLQDFMLEYVSKIDQINDMQDYGHKNFIIYLYLISTNNILNWEFNGLTSLLFYAVKKLYSTIYKKLDMTEDWLEAKKIYNKFDKRFIDNMDSLLEVKKEDNGKKKRNKEVVEEVSEEEGDDVQDATLTERCDI